MIKLSKDKTELRCTICGTLLVLEYPDNSSKTKMLKIMMQHFHRK